MSWRFWRKSAPAPRRRRPVHDAASWAGIIICTFHANRGRNRTNAWQEICHVAREIGSLDKDVFVGCVRAARDLKGAGLLAEFLVWLRPERSELEFADSPFVT